MKEYMPNDSLNESTYCYNLSDFVLQRKEKVYVINPNEKSKK